MKSEGKLEHVRSGKDAPSLKHIVYVPAKSTNPQILADWMTTLATYVSGAATRHGAFGGDHEKGQRQQEQGQGEGSALVEQSVAVDGLREGFEPHQVDGAEVAHRVEEDQQGAGGDRRGGLGQDDPAKDPQGPVAEQSGILLERGGQAGQPGGHLQVHVGVGEEGEDQPGADETVEAQLQVYAEVPGQIVDLSLIHI